MAAVHMAASKATWAFALGTAILAVLTMLVRRHGANLVAAVFEAANWAICAGLLLTQPNSPRKRAVYNALGTWTWAVRITSLACTAFISTNQQRLVPLLTKGTLHVLIVITLLWHTVATQHMATRLRVALTFVYACVLGRLTVYVTSIAAAEASPARVPWWHQLALYALAQLCVHGPYTLLAHVWARQAKRMAAPPAPRPPSTTGALPGGDVCDMLPSDTAKPACGCGKGPALCDHAAPAAHTASPAFPSTNGVSALDPTCESQRKMPDLGVPAVPAAPPGATALASADSHARQQQSASLASTATMVQTLRATRYASKLGPQHKVCLKLDTSTTCDALPPDLADHIQHALSSVMGPSSLRVTELAVRSGCVMLTMTICRTAGHAAGEDGSGYPPMGPEDPSTSAPADEQLAATIGQALLQRICRPAAPGTSGHTADSVGAAADGLIACQRALLQVDAQLMAATWQEEAWDLRALVTVPASKGSRDSAGSICASASAAGTAVAPWLGVVTACEQLPPAAVPDTLLRSGSTSCCDEGSGGPEVSFSVGVQLWGLGKLDVVEGWQPAPEGAHTWPVHGHGTHQDAGSLPGRELKLLARSVGGTYLVTSVQHVISSAAPGAGVKTAQAVVSLPDCELVRHHAVGLPSQLLLLVLELWEGEVLRSSTPLLAATAAGTAADSCSLQAWWWGAADPAVAAALSDLQLCAQALGEGGEAAADVLPSHLAFMADLGVWLVGVRRCALSSQQLCAMATHTCQHGQLAAAGLPPAELQQLGEDLLAHAGRIELRAVQAMVQQQMQRTVLPAVKQQQRGQQQRGQWRAWLQGLRNVALGYHCQQCEAAYKQHLALRLSRVQAASSGGTALYVLAANCSAVAMGDYLVRTAIASGPWVLLHSLGAWLRSAHPTAAPVDTLRWSTAAYLWRVVVRLLLHLGLVPKMRFSSWFCRSVRVWPLTYLVLVATEQVQAGAVLSAPWMLAVTCLLETPAMLLCAWQEATCGVFTLTLLVAPTVMVGARLAIDARMRRSWLLDAVGRRTSPAARAAKLAESKAGSTADLGLGSTHKKLE